MNFNNPIPRAVQPLYNEGSALRPSRDSDTVGQAWKKNDAVNAQLKSIVQNVAKLQTDIGKLKKRQTGYLLPQSTENFYPFKLYQPDPSNYPANINTIGTTFDQNGNASMVYINPSIPTNLMSVPPTINPNTDSWRLWLIRDGIVEIRPYYSVIIDLQNGGYESDGPAINNFAFQQDVYFGTDLFANQYDAQSAAGGVTNGFFETTGESEFGFPDANIYGGTLVIGGPFMDTGEPSEAPSVFFWIEITPDTNDIQVPLARIKLRRYGGGAGGAYDNLPMPAYSPFIIPVGFVTFYGDETSFNIDQRIFNHAIFRWQTAVLPTQYTGLGAQVIAPPSQANLYTTTMIGANQYRGNWQTDSAVIADQVFYPGDYVIYNSTTMGATLQQINYVCSQVRFTTDPSNDDYFLMAGSYVSQT